jgi:hypothetical protein
MGTSPIAVGVGNSAEAPQELITPAQGIAPPAQGQPPGANQAEFVFCDQAIERLWVRLKEWRAVATRYEKTACSFMGVLCMAAAMDWLKS